MLGARLRGFAAKATFQAGCDYYPERVSVTTDAEGSAEVLTRCYAGNTNVGMVVDGVGAWGQFDVAYAR